MPSWKFSRRSANLLSKGHPDLRAVARLALKKSPLDFAVTEVLRTLPTQKRMVAEGKSETLNSRHLTGHALDFAPIVDGKVSWDFKHAQAIAWAFKEASRELGIPITWGGEWRSRDGVHIQLAWGAYPLADKPVKTPKTSKTVAAAAAVPLTAVAGKAMEMTHVLGQYGQWGALAALGVVATLGGFIIYERIKKMQEHGV